MVDVWPGVLLGCVGKSIATIAAVGSNTEGEVVKDASISVDEDS